MTVVEKHCLSTVKTQHAASSIRSSRVEGLKNRASLPGSIPPLSTWLLGRCSDDTVTSCFARSAYSTTFMHILPAALLLAAWTASCEKSGYAGGPDLRERPRSHAPTHPRFPGTPLTALGRLHRVFVERRRGMGRGFLQVL